MYGTGADADKVVGLKQNDTQIKSYVYDELNRVTSQTVNTTTPITTTYTYVDHPTEDGRTSALVESMQVGAEDVRRFVYDANGNIIAEYKGATQQMLFEYDAKGQLLKATNYHSVSRSQVFTYDSSGNILTKSSGAGTVTYQYTDSSWGDLLTSYDGQQITYDAIGNPLTDYYGRTFTWKNGRQLATANVDGVQMSFEYNEDGLRSAKIVDGARTEYFYQGSLLVCEKKTDAQGNLEYVLHFTYDEAGRPFSMTYDGATYYYVYDVYGNVNYIYNAVGEKIITVTYDDVHGSFFAPRYSSNTTTGRALSSTVYMLSPFLYKGYYYDNDLYLYYCGSRYYDPEIGRWINADNRISGIGGNILGYNMFAYCMNNPVNMSDPTGSWPKWIETAANWVNNNIIQPVKNFFSSSKQSNVVNASSHDANRRPYTGEPGSTYTAPNGDSRTYGPDGTPEHDYDHDDHGRPDKHPHDPNGGHNHDWENGVRGPAYSIGWEPIAGVALVTVCVIGIVVVAADDATGIGVADDFLFGPLGAGVGEGLILIFG